MRSTDSARTGSHPIPYTVSVGKITTPPRPTTLATASAIAEGRNRFESTVRVNESRSVTDAQPGSDRDARKRIVRNDDRNSRDFPEQRIEPT